MPPPPPPRSRSTVSGLLSSAAAASPNATAQLNQVRTTLAVHNKNQRMMKEAEDEKNEKHNALATMYEDIKNTVVTEGGRRRGRRTQRTKSTRRHRRRSTKTHKRR